MPSSHLRKAFDPVQLRRIAAAAEVLRNEHEAEIVLARGLSGTIIATAMSTLFGTPIAIVRKDNEVSHGRAVEVVDWDEDVNVAKTYGDFIIVDDLIASGKTVQAIIDVTENRVVFQGECRGIILYHSDTKETSSYFLRDGNAIPVFYLGLVL